jgi:predicted glycosyltransferase
MERRGHLIRVTARDKDVTRQLLNAYAIPYQPVGNPQSMRKGLIREWALRDWLIFKEARRFDPDCLMGVLNPAVAHSSWLLGRTSVIFNDSEPEAVGFPIADILTIPFSSTIISPTSMRHDYGKKGIRVRSYKELAYLHPQNFSPDVNILRELCLCPEEYVILRFIGWQAYHDHWKNGLSLKAKRMLIDELGKSSKVLISSESQLPKDLERYRLNITPDKLHHLIFYAKMLVCDSQTMATEAAILGTPAIRCNSFVGKKDMGNFQELECRYHLLLNYRDEEKAVEKAKELVESADIKDVWRERREICLKDKIDLSRFMVDYVEGLDDQSHNVGDQSG